MELYRIWETNISHEQSEYIAKLIGIRIIQSFIVRMSKEN